MAKVDISLTNTAIVGLMAFAFIVIAKMVIRSFPVPAIVRTTADMV